MLKTSMIWSEQGHGMAEYATWLALTEAGLGATLQHYNPLIDAEVAQPLIFLTTGGYAPRCHLAQLKQLLVKDVISDAERFKFLTNRT